MLIYILEPSTYGQSQPPQVAYAGQQAHAYQQQGVPYTAGPPTTKYASTPTVATQSAFTSYPGHYAQQQKPLADAYTHNYPLQRMQQTGKKICF